MPRKRKENIEAAETKAAEAEAETKAAEVTEARAREASPLPPYVIGEGKSLTSGSRVLVPGDEVTEADVDDFKGFLESGHIVKTG